MLEQNTFKIFVKELIFNKSWRPSASKFSKSRASLQVYFKDYAFFLET